MASRQWQVCSGKWEMNNGKWEMGNVLFLVSAHFSAPIFKYPLIIAYVSIPKDPITQSLAPIYRCPFLSSYFSEPICRSQFGSVHLPVSTCDYPFVSACVPLPIFLRPICRCPRVLNQWSLSPLPLSICQCPFTIPYLPVPIS